MKPKITFQDGPRVIIADSRDFSEPPPINQVLELRDNSYQVVGYQSVTVLVKPVERVDERAAPKKAKRVAKKQAKAAAKSKRAEKGKTTGDGKTAATAVKGKWYNPKSN